jgi:hypothetical protein
MFPSLLDCDRKGLKCCAKSSEDRELDTFSRPTHAPSQKRVVLNLPRTSRSARPASPKSVLYLPRYSRDTTSFLLTAPISLTCLPQRREKHKLPSNASLPSTSALSTESKTSSTTSTGFMLPSRSVPTPISHSSYGSPGKSSHFMGTGLQANSPTRFPLSTKTSQSETSTST